MNDDDDCSLSIAPQPPSCGPTSVSSWIGTLLRLGPVHQLNTCSVSVMSLAHCWHDARTRSNSKSQNPIIRPVFPQQIATTYSNFPVGSFPKFHYSDTTDMLPTCYGLVSDTAKLQTILICQNSWKLQLPRLQRKSV